MGISDDFRSENPRITDSAKNVQDAISVDKQRSVHDIANITGLSHGMESSGFDVDFCQDEYNEWVERNIKCVACGGSYFEKE